MASSSQSLSSSNTFRSIALSVVVSAAVSAVMMSSLMRHLGGLLRRGSHQHQQQQTSIYKLIYTVPPSHLAATKRAVFAAGGGTYEAGKYTNTTFESAGVGVFTPDRDARPTLGAVGVEERVDEVRVEVRCEGFAVATEAVKALLRSHPYETVGYEVFKAEDSLMGITKSYATKSTSR